MIIDNIKMAFGNMRHRQVRSWLTMMGIFIGITSVIAIISLGQGLQMAINDQFANLGTDKLFLTPGASSFGTDAIKLTDHDISVIKRVSGVDSAMGLAYQSAKITRKNDMTYNVVIGADITSENVRLWKDVLGSNLGEGRLIESGDTFKTYVGYDYTQDNKIFPKGLKLYDKININGQDFEIVGFQKKIGSSQDDAQVYITAEAYQRVFNADVKNDYKQVIIKTSLEQDPNKIAADVKQQLRKDHGKKIGEEDFTLQTTEQLMDSFNSVLLIVQVVIIGIAAISLLIGGIGIMNTMYTAVVERTQEIGIMKAIGARNSDILTIFMVEAGVLGLVGGAIGVALGLGIAKMVEILGGLYLGTPLLRAWWSWELILGALAFAFIVGIVSGTFPAYQASKHKPVESLRYE